MNDYISFDDIRTTRVGQPFLNENELKFVEEGENIYQVQSVKNQTKSSIMHVGFMQKASDILIKTFDISIQYKCHMVSKIYNETILKEIEKNCIFQIIKIIICFNDGTKFTPIAYLSFNFHTFEHIQKNVSILECLSTKENPNQLYGFYSITLHFKENDKNKFINLETFKEFPGNEKILVLLTEWLLREEISLILNKSI